MANAANLLTDRCTIQTKSPTGTDSYGHETYTWADTYTNVACRLGGFSGGRERFGEANVGVIELRLWLLANQAIDREDRVVLDGITYEVTGWRYSYDGAGSVHHRAAYLRRID